MPSPTPLISFIIPVYNAEKYLEKCIESVINQTYHKLEIILIDDGSKDNSGKICDKYKAKDPRVIVIHQCNQGVSKARSCGLKIANGEYIMFLDSDDWVDSIICEMMLNALSKYNVQSAMCSYVREYGDRSLPKIINPCDIVIDNKTLLRRLCGLVGKELRNPENLENYNMMCGKIYPASALTGISFADIAQVGSSEDLLFNLDVFSVVKSMVYVNQPFYHYRRNLTTSISGTYKPNLEQQWINVYNKIQNLIENNQLDNQYTSALNNRIALNVLGLGLNCLSSGVGCFEKYQKLDEIITDPRRKAALKRLCTKHMPLHWKLFYFSARYRLTPLLYTLLVLIKKLRGKV